jgi:DNA repair protein RadC
MGKSDNWSMYEIEITRKYKDDEDTLRPRIISPETAYNLFKDTAVSLDQESLWVLSLDGQNGLIGIQKVYTGTATGTSVRIAEIVRATIIQNAPGMVMVHNHPSGNIEASNADMELTAEMCKAAKLLDIELLDHLIVGEDGYTSIRAGNQDLWNPELVVEDFNNALEKIMKGGDVNGKETADPVC